MTRLTLKNISLKRQGKTLLKDINWTVNQGENWAVIGLNGSGKTTLLKLLMAEYFPSEGEISVSGFTFGQGDITPLRQKIGVVGSFISERLPTFFTAEKIVLTGKYKSSILYKDYGDDELDEAKAMLEQIGGQALIGREYHLLSQGEKQLTLIARSLMEKPDIVILDEATSGLDLFAREKLLTHIKRIRTLGHQPTIIYITHHLEELTEDITHVLLLRKGEIMTQGPKKEVLKEDILEQFYQQKISIVPLEQNRFYIYPKLN